MSPEQWASEKGVRDVLAALEAGGMKVALTPEQVALAGELVLALVQAFSGAALKRAAAAGVAAAAAVTTVEQANSVLGAAAAAQEAK